MNRLLLSLLVAFCHFATTRAYALEYAFTNIADNVMPSPFGAFESFGDPAISGNAVTFRGRYINPGDLEVKSGVFIGSGGPLTTIAKQGDNAPSGTFLGLSDPTISDGRVAFGATYRNPSLAFTETGIFTGIGGSLTTIAKSGDPAPPGILSTSQSLAPSISGGMVAFRSGFTNDKKGILTGTGGPLTSIVTTGDAAPSGTFGFNPFGDPTISDGTVAFKGGYPGGGGIFIGSGGPLTPIVTTADPAPEGVFTDFSDPSISGGIVAFAGRYDGGDGVFTGDGVQLKTIVLVGDAAPIGTFTSAGGASISGDAVAFIGAYDGLSQRGIFVSSGGPLTSIVQTGDPLFGSTVATLSFRRFGLDPDGSGNVAFGYELADGRFGIAMARVVPEPSVFDLTSLAAVGILLFARRLRTARRYIF